MQLPFPHSIKRPHFNTDKSLHFVPHQNRTTLEMPLDFVVVDLETTGRNPKIDDICEIAALKIKNGEIIDSFDELVYIDGEMPKGAENTHHISKDMLKKAPHMKIAMSWFLDFIGSNSVLVGHNIQGFDIKLLKRVANACAFSFAYAGLFDTLQLARNAWPHLPKHTMDALREALGLEQQGAHRALKDCADVCELYMTIRRDVVEGKPPQLFEIHTPSSSRRGRSEVWNRKRAKDFSPTVQDFDTSHPLYEKNVVLSGNIEGHSYEEVLQYVCDCGGTPQDNVTRKTDYLIVGSGAGKGKTNKARDNQENGIPTIILDEESFKQLVNWE